MKYEELPKWAKKNVEHVSKIAPIQLCGYEKKDIVFACNDTNCPGISTERLFIGTSPDGKSVFAIKRFDAKCPKCKKKNFHPVEIRGDQDIAMLRAIAMKNKNVKYFKLGQSADENEIPDMIKECRNNKTHITRNFDGIKIIIINDDI